MHPAITFFILLSFWATFSGSGYASEPQQIRYTQGDPKTHYMSQLLQYALDITQSEYGEAKINLVARPTGKPEIALLRNQFDIGYFVASDARDRGLLAIKVPLLQGMLGYRLLLTTTKTRQTLAQHHQLSDFQQRLIGGSGLLWVDLQIYIHNKLLVKTAATTPELFAMLSRAEIDYFARGVNEVFGELEHNSRHIKQLEISSDVAFFYPFAVYFYVVSGNKELAERVEKGLQIAEQDGYFQKLFLAHFQQNIERLKELNPKQIIYLDNPKYHAEHSVHYHWWLEAQVVEQLKQSRMELTSP